MIMTWIRRCLKPAAAIVALLATANAARANDPQPVAGNKPNVLLILVDDMGYSDLGCYGGEIATPHLDRLAENGLRFTQFYNTARCWPSRAAILTGYYAQQVRRDTVPGLRSGGQGLRPTWARLLPDHLRPLGYRSYHSGKWHVDGLPVQGGFDRSYLIQDQDRHFSPRSHSLDDKPLAPVKPDTGFYGAVAIVDHAVECLQDHAANHGGKPFFHYLAFTTPHFPLHALPEDIAKYKDRFNAGWDSLRAERLARMKKLGLIDCELSPRTAGTPAWNELSTEEREAWAVRMAIHAGMVDRIDQEIGRVLKQLEAMEALDNTLIFFMSDNGASAERILRGDGHDPAAPPGSWRSYLCLEPGWANLANTPLRYSKIYVHEGGISTPLIAHWPRGIAARGELRHNPAHLIDLAPTIVELAGGKWPAQWQDQQVPPTPGRNLAPAFAKDGTVSHDYLWWFHSGNRAIRIGDWKLVSEGEQGTWELYNLATDRGESHNLATDEPDRVREMEKAWNARLTEFSTLARRDLPPGYETEAPAKKKKKRATK